MARARGGTSGIEGVDRRGKRKHGHPVCLRNGKIRYRDGRDATLALKSLTRKRSRADLVGGSHNINVKRKYECPSCGGWHLTSWADATAPSAAA